MTRRRGLAAGLVALTAFAAAATAGRADATPVGDVPQSVPRGKRVVMFTDSVGLGAEFALPRAFPADWQVRVDGRPAEMVGELEQNFVLPRLASDPDWFGDHVVIAAAYNAPYWDWPRLDREIDSIVNTLTAAGVEHVYWVTLREVKPQYISAGAWRQIQPYYWYFPTVNDHLEAALERHPNLSLVDFAAAADRPGITYDAIHLNNDGAALYSALIRQRVDAAATTVADGSTTRVHVDGGEGAAAAAVNVTTTGPRTDGFLTLHRCDRPPPLVSMHNHRRDETVAHAGVVALDANGDFCVTTRVATNLVVDVTGLFPEGGGFAAVEPTRWLDTRELPGRLPVTPFEVVELDLDDVRARAGVGDDVTAVAIVATAVEAAAPGWLRVVTCGHTAAETSNVNYFDASAIPNLVVVAPDRGGSICITSSATTQLVVDLFGTFDADAGVAGDDAQRVFDSRDTGARVAAGSVTVIDVVAAGIDPAASGALMNLTAVDALAPGFATAYPCAAGRPGSSNLNISGAAAVANAVMIAPDEAGEICVYALSPMHLIVDVMGEVGPAFEGVVPARALDTRER
ncbi:MAG: hypothetical protein QNJ12_21030 [Ilumatobacter sp.]|uniref:hypothetical protein n=1 Tax=Ilumatobacter sp. TaxID=1967498 RepID=UPI00262E383C|nr:hypothetical protein [Ilumatobacter sp.]MDJ0771286.1 hypothetical protein [Ilumatobacter sp.]